jgi:hypothetical protein
MFGPCLVPADTVTWGFQCVIATQWPPSMPQVRTGESESLEVGSLQAEGPLHVSIKAKFQISNTA